MNKVAILIAVLLVSGFLRFYQLGAIPAGLHGDAASQGYNAFSLIHTGQDRYGQPYPILFRAYGSYQPPVYTYLTTIPVSIFGNTVFAVRFISALSGVILVLMTYFFFSLLFEGKNKFSLAIISSLLVAIAPWSVFFSRLSVEANLGLTLFALSILLFIVSLRKILIFPIACFILGVSTHAYYSERLISVIFLPIFIFLFRKAFSKHRRRIIFGLAVFIIVQIPNLFIFNSGAFATRFEQVSYIGDNSKVNQIENLLNFAKTFFKNYLIYYSPKYLFFSSDSSIGRTMPELSVFYSWLLIPFMLGVRYLIKNKNKFLDVFRIVGLLLVITPIPASLTGDIFYPLRTLELLWIITLVIAVGIYTIYHSIKNKIVKILLSGFVILYSCFSLYISYFILFKYEKAENYGYSYIKLMDKLSEYSNKHIVIDLARDLGIGVRFAYLKRYDPEKMQAQLKPQLKTPYYNSVVNADEIYMIDNIEVRPIFWKGDIYKEQILVGDSLAISDEQIKEHNLKFEFEIKNMSGKVSLKGYSTNPKEKRESDKLKK